MNRNNIIIIVLIVIIASLLVGIVAVMPNISKQNTNLTFKSNSTLSEGDSLKIKLTDDNGTALANQTVNITVTGKDKSSDYHSVVTNEKGIGTLKIDKNPGKYNITISYGGNDKYNGCNATKKITIEEEEVVVEETSSYSESSTYTEHLNGGDVEVDSNGNVVGSYNPDGEYFEGGQLSGMSIEEAREFDDYVSKNGMK